MVKMDKLYLTINGNCYNLELDVETYNRLLQDNTYAIEYAKTLITNKIIDEPNLQTLEISQDNKHMTHLIEENDLISENKENDKNPEGVTWTDAATKFMLDRYEEYLPNVGAMKKFKRKKNLWEQLSLDLEKYLNIKKSAIQCENRWKTILKRKKTAIYTNNKSGEAPVTIQFQDELDKIKAIDDSIEPEIMLAPGKIIVKKNKHESRFELENLTENEASGSGTSGTSGTIEISRSKVNKMKKRSIDEVLWDIHNNKEENRNKRHQEKMAMLEKIYEKLIP